MESKEKRNFCRGESVHDAWLNYEAEKEAEMGNETAPTGEIAAENESSYVANENENINEIGAESEGDDSADSTYECGNEADTEDDSVSDGGSDFDEEYVSAREKKKGLNRSVPDGIDGLGLDDMLNAPGGVASINGKYWEGGAAGNLEAYRVIEENECASDYAASDDGLVTPSSSSEDNLEVRKKKKETKLYYNPKCNHEELEWKMHMIFLNRLQVRQALQQWAVCRGHDIRVRKSERCKVEARCKPGCTFRFYASKSTRCSSFKIAGLTPEHTCERATKNTQATSEWVAKEFIQKFRRQPGYKPADMQVDLKYKYHGLLVSTSCCNRAKRIAMSIIRGSLESHYAKFRAYDAELKRVDPDGLFEFHCINDAANGAPIFQRYYVGFSGLRRGFVNGCRRILCVDGCFLKTLVGGVLLSAVGRDGNNQMFPVAWAIAEAENEESWTWFMKLLISDLGFGEGLYLTIVSDQQKGLRNAIHTVARFAEHRNCARHIYANWKKHHKDPELKLIFWNAVNSTNIPLFDLVMGIMKAENVGAHEDFKKQLTNIFCKAHIRTDTKCDAITSNLVETFNGYIAKARQLQVINMLEEIRTSLMARMYLKSQLMENHFEDICPKVREKIDKNQLATRNCIPTPAVGGAFQVVVGEDQYVVCLKNKRCSCRAWDITGIPCAHALASINFMRYNVVDYVDDYYKKETYMKAYEFSLQPLNGFRMWPRAEGVNILPPPFRKKPGRPKKNRRKDPDEEPKKPARYARKGVAMTCRHCLGEGHNKRGCPNKDNAPTERPERRPRGRPRGPKWTDQTPAAKGNENAAASSKMRKKRKAELLERTIASQRNASTPEQRSAVHDAIQNQALDNVGIRVNTSSGLIFARAAAKDGNRYVSGPRAAAAAARGPISSQQGSTTDQGSQAPKTSQPGSTTNLNARPPTSVMFKSTASQAATPRLEKLPVTKGKRKMHQ